MYGLAGNERDQAASRRGATLTDDWGRPWSATIDKKTGDPIGTITPQGWSAPWRPEPAYMRPDPENPRRLIIDLDRALAETLEAHEQYTEDWNRAAAARNLDPTDTRNHATLAQQVGPRPKPWQPIKAALDGNKYILGFSTKVDPRLVPFLTTKRDRAAAKLDTLDSFADDEEAEALEARMDLEEAVDAEAIGGKRIAASKPVKKARKLTPVPLSE